jgi:hypothetical protein
MPYLGQENKTMTRNRVSAQLASEGGFSKMNQSIPSAILRQRRPGTAGFLALAALLVPCLLPAEGPPQGLLTEWSQAESIDAGGSSVNTPDTEGCPIEALDGNTLYFASNPGKCGEDAIQSDPVNAGLPGVGQIDDARRIDGHILGVAE